MKVVIQGQDPETVPFHLVCSKCSTVVELLKSELIQGQSDRPGMVEPSYVKCPVCKSFVYDSPDCQKKAELKLAERNAGSTEEAARKLLLENERATRAKRDREAENRQRDEEDARRAAQEEQNYWRRQGYGGSGGMGSGGGGATGPLMPPEVEPRFAGPRKAIRTIKALTPKSRDGLKVIY